MATLVTLVKPILIQAMNSCATKKLVCDLLDRYVKTTDNDVDDVIAITVRNALLRECR